MNKTTKTYKAIVPLADTILNGRILCIDPSTGSQSSMPGFALFEKGEMVEMGIFDIPLNMNRSRKLYEIARTIREEFPPADLLIVEYIPPVGYKGGMNSLSLMALQRAIGAIIGSKPFDNLLEIPASAWGKYKPDDYEKSDEFDALCLGLCAIGVARQIKEGK